ncbi:Holliday junction branch migration DNA helicase RuvB [Candidatus Dependentiae bacterium]|nr:Holliday junction branch migration DNA helicase RuvB [Candidatus Dependentiae bacterium]
MKSTLNGPIELFNFQQKPEDIQQQDGPQTFQDYLGQEVIKQKLSVYVKACAQREEPLDHLLIFGPAGLGKTTLARVIAKELNVPFKVTSAPVLERGGDLVAILSGLAPREVLFIDEIHRLPKPVEEVLYSAMQEFAVDMMIGQGAMAKSVRLPLNPFTLIGATTKTGMISAPLQTRFGIVERLDFYTAEELGTIAEQNAKYLNISIDPDAATLIGSRARGTPRIVKRILRRVRDFAQVHGNNSHISMDLAKQGLSFLGLDDDGLSKLDREILLVLLRDFDGGPVGLETLAAITGEDKETIEDFCEPYLLRQGLLQKTPRGRQIPPSKMMALRKKFLVESISLQKSIFDETP